MYSQFTFFSVTRQNPIQANIKSKQTSCILCIYINIETIHQRRKTRKQKLKLFGYKISNDIRTYNNYKANKTPKNQHPLPLSQNSKTLISQLSTPLPGLNLRNSFLSQPFLMILTILGGGFWRRHRSEFGSVVVVGVWVGQ